MPTFIGALSRWQGLKINTDVLNSNKYAQLLKEMILKPGGFYSVNLLFVRLRRDWMSLPISALQQWLEIMKKIDFAGGLNSVS